VQPFESFHEQEEHAGAEAEQREGNSGGDAPEGAGGRTTIVAVADNDVAGDGDEQFEDTGAQEPAIDALEQRFRVVPFGNAAKDNGPNEPEAGEGKQGPTVIAPSRIVAVCRWGREDR